MIPIISRSGHRSRSEGDLTFTFAERFASNSSHKLILTSSKLQAFDSDSQIVVHNPTMKLLHLLIAYDWQSGALMRLPELGSHCTMETTVRPSPPSLPN